MIAIESPISPHIFDLKKWDVPSTLAGPPTQNWYQVNQDGFVSSLGSSDGAVLFIFDDKLYAWNSNGFFRMEDPALKIWMKLTPPAPPAGPGQVPSLFIPFGNYLYVWDNNQLWWIEKGKDPNGSNWNKVTSVGLPGGSSPVPMAMFGSNIYGVYYTSSNAFEIWRTPNIGSATANWDCVVKNSFGDPKNNQSVDIITVFNGHIYAGIGTLKLGSFGNPTYYGTGVEIWESSTGNLGSWTQVNVDGFGTKFSGCIGGVCNFAIHQVIGSSAVYKAPGQTQEYLYIGTLSHFGAEIWRYDGKGKSGWKNVTPSWAGPCQIGCGPGRNLAMSVFQNNLYLAEGFPTANLAKYDGTTWSIVVSGPTPFDPDNKQLPSLAVFKNRLYVSAGWPASAPGDQVWGYPFKTPKPNVKANGSDGPINVSPTTAVTITVELDVGELAGLKADWYVVALTPGGWYSLVWGKGWVSGIVPIAQSPLFNVSSPLPIFNGSFPAGNYLAFFGVDDKPDSKLNGTLWWDSVLIVSK